MGPVVGKAEQEYRGHYAPGELCSAPYRRRHLERSCIGPSHSEKKHGIDVDSKENGVFLPNLNNTDGLPGILHNGKHPNSYFGKVNQLLRDAGAGGKQTVLE